MNIGAKKDILYYPGFPGSDTEINKHHGTNKSQVNQKIPVLENIKGDSKKQWPQSCQIVSRGLDHSRKRSRCFFMVSPQSDQGIGH